MRKELTLLAVLCWAFGASIVQAQEEYISAFEVSIDQDAFADFLHDDPVEAYNYATGIRLGFYGELANSDFLGLPWVRKKIDGFLIDPIFRHTYLRHGGESHNFVMTINGFSPAFISDETPLFSDTLAAGYDLAQDLPFSSFTGFRSTRRLEKYRNVAHSAGLFDMAISTSFTFGFASLGAIRGVENIFGFDRPDGNLWKRDESKPYPTGQLNHTMVPIFMYSVSVESVILRPFRKIVLQMRPEINLGYYTDIGFGLDFGKVMSTERLIDNLSYTDLHNPGVAAINDKDIGFALAGGVMARAVAYNAHYHGFFGWNKREEWAWDETERFLFEGYVGMKLQFYSKVELNFSVNVRSSALDLEDDYKIWGTAGLKYLMGAPGEGCYD